MNYNLKIRENLIAVRQVLFNQRHSRAIFYKHCFWNKPNN